jgi:hypothetical protein
LARFLAQPPESFFERLRAGHRRPYVETRAALWMLGALGFFQRKRKMPFYLVEVNSGAGLNLAADVLAKKKGFDSGLVAARIGLDPEPLLVSDIGQRRWLTAALPPEDVDGIAAMDRAADFVQEQVSKDPAFIQLAPCAPESAPKFMLKNVPPDADTGLLIFNAGTTVRMSDEQYSAYRGEMAKVLQSWGDRGLWIEVETVRGETYSTTIQVRMNRARGEGGLSQLIAMSLDFGAAKADYDAAALSSFLEV